MRRRWAGPAAWVLAAAPAAALATYAWLGLHSRYLADDYGFVLALREHGFFGAQIASYRDWSGRVVSTFFSSLLALGGPALTPAVAAILLLLWCAAAIRAVAALLPGAVRAARWLLALAFVWACCDAAADIFQSLFWQTGAVTYVLPLAFLAACVALVARVQAPLAPLPFVALLASASSEILAATTTAAAAIAAASSAGALRRRALAALAGAALGLVIVAAAPGNAVRRAHFPASPPLPDAVARTVAQSVHYCSAFVSRAAVPALVVFTAAALAASLSGGAAISAKGVAAAWLAAAAAIALAHAITVHAGSGAPPGRGLITTDVFVFGAIALSGLHAGRFVAGDRRQMLVAVAAAVLMMAGPAVALLRNATLVPQAHAFARRWDAADARLRASRGEPVMLDVPVRVGGLLWVTRDAAHPVNRTVADFYGVEAVAARQ